MMKKTKTVNAKMCFESLNKADFKFVEDFCEKYTIRTGQGVRPFICLFLHDYKVARGMGKK